MPAATGLPGDKNDNYKVKQYHAGYGYDPKWPRRNIPSRNN